MGLLDQHTMFLSAADCGRTKDIYGVSYMIFIFLFKSPTQQNLSDDHPGQAVCHQETGMVMDVYPC